MTFGPLADLSGSSGRWAAAEALASSCLGRPRLCASYTGPQPELGSGRARQLTRDLIAQTGISPWALRYKLRTQFRDVMAAR
jgi:hypothetical protein